MMGKKSLGHGIKALVESVLDKKLKEYDSIIDKKLERVRMSGSGKGFDKLAKVIDNQTIDIEYLNKQVSKISKEIDGIRSIGPASRKRWLKSASGSESMEERVMKEIAKVSEQTVKDFVDLRKMVQDLVGQVDDLKDKMTSVIEDRPLRQSDVKDLRRIMETLRTRTQWLEDRIENFSVEALVNKIDELESKFDVIKRSSPLVVE